MRKSVVEVRKSDKELRKGGISVYSSRSGKSWSIFVFSAIVRGSVANVFGLLET